MNYKSISLALMSLLLTGQLFAQNSFPSSGDVGIGTTSPVANLEIVGSGTIGGSWNPSGSYFKIGNGGSGGMIFDPNEIYSSGGMYLGSSYSDHFYFRNVGSNGIEHLMIIQNDGKVGVGTSSPSHKLHVNNGDLFIGKNTQSIRTELNSNSGYSRFMFNGADHYLISYGSSHSSEAHKLALKSNHDSGSLGFFTTNIERLSILPSGYIGIGTKNPTSKLTVKGTARAEEIIVEEDLGADFVFSNDYALPTLSEVEQHIKTKKHLPEIPSAEEMIANGVKVGELQMKLLQKIEELTLYTIELKKQIDHIKKGKKLLVEKNKILEQQINKIIEDNND